MDLSLTETQQLLKTGVQDFLARDASRPSLLELEGTELGYSPDHWRTAAEIGWLGMATPEAYGGAGASLTDIAVVFEALGGGPVPGPFFSSGVLAPLILQEAGTDDQRARYLPALAAGDLVATLAMTEPDWAWGPEGVSMVCEPVAGGGYRLRGDKLFVYDAHAAHLFIVVARMAGTSGPEGLTLVMVDAADPRVSARRLDGFLTSEGAVHLDGVEVGAHAVLGGATAVGAGWAPLERALLRATPVLCAYALGGAQAVFEMSVEYSRERRQFGQPIGRFQHVQNHIVQLVNHVDAARWTTYEALWKLDAGKPGAQVSVHLARVSAAEGYVQAANYAHEVHAGIGVMREYGLTMFTRLSRSLYHALGDPAWHRRRLRELLPQHEMAAAG